MDVGNSVKVVKRDLMLILYVISSFIVALGILFFYDQKTGAIESASRFISDLFLKN